MGTQGLVLAVVAASAALAGWVHLRRDGRMPETGRRVVLHTLAALCATGIVPFLMRRIGTDESATAAMASLFALVLPMFVYNFLTWLWLLKLLQRRLHVG
jgi:hypothetical protein